MGLLGDGGRLIRAGWVLARYDALLPAEYQDKAPPWMRWAGRASRLLARRDRAENPGERFARALERLGPAYVKLGQFLSTRSDILEARFARGLARLQDQAKPFSDAVARRAVADALGRPLEEAFATFGPPAGAASVAQVHKAVTPLGETLAVKILRPGIKRQIAKDMAAFHRAARWVAAAFPPARRLEPVAFVATLERSLALECDLRLEAAACSELAEHARDLDGFETPSVDWSRTAARVLATEWINGAKLTDEAALEAQGVDRPSLAITVVRAFLSTALDHGVFHADMHPGNLFARGRSTLVAVDFGIVGRIGPRERRYLAEILFGFLRRDYRRIAEVHFEAGYVPSHFEVDDFAQALRAVGEPIFGKTADQVAMSRLLTQLFDVTALFDMRMRPELVLLQKTMVQVEGVARRLDPQGDIWSAARPVVERWIARELGPEGVISQAASDGRELLIAAQRLPATIHDLATAAERLAHAPAQTRERAQPRLWLAMGLGGGLALLGVGLGWAIG
ncbi:MAG: 2-polyprenylphenol 6-hydroxylase [Maricaulaceae bacterium]